MTEGRVQKVGHHVEHHAHACIVLGRKLLRPGQCPIFARALVALHPDKQTARLYLERTAARRNMSVRVVMDAPVDHRPGTCLAVRFQDSDAFSLDGPSVDTRRQQLDGGRRMHVA